MIDASGPNAPKPGDTAVFGFRGQAFVTRAYVVGVSGISQGHAQGRDDRERFRRNRCLAGLGDCHDCDRERNATHRSCSCKDIRKTFGGIIAIENFSLEIYPGEIVALVGDNGAGKSTLIKIISGVYAPTSGTITIEGETVTMSSATMARAHGIEVVYQDLALADQQTVYMNMFLGREPVNALRPARPSQDDRRDRKAGEGTGRSHPLRARDDPRPLRRPAPGRGDCARHPLGKQADPARRADRGARRRGNREGGRDRASR